MMNAPKKDDCKPSVRLKSRMKKLNCELVLHFEPFPSEKAREKAYRTWVKTYIKTLRNR